MPADKASTLKLVDNEYQKLLKAIEGLERPQMEEVWYDQWSIKQIIAHIMGWERAMTEGLERITRGERPTPEGVDYSDADAWNARFALNAAPIMANTIVAAWGQAHATYMKAAEAVPEDRFGEADGKLKTANRILEASAYGHYPEHTAPILEWRQQRGL